MSDSGRHDIRYIPTWIPALGRGSAEERNLHPEFLNHTVFQTILISLNLNIPFSKSNNQIKGLQHPFLNRFNMNIGQNLFNNFNVFNVQLLLRLHGKHQQLHDWKVFLGIAVWLGLLHALVEGGGVAGLGPYLVCTTVNILIWRGSTCRALNEFNPKRQSLANRKNLIT